MISTGVHYLWVAAANQFRLSVKSVGVQPLGYGLEGPSFIEFGPRCQAFLKLLFSNTHRKLVRPGGQGDWQSPHIRRGGL
jgi:hypothetical protein